MPSSMRNHPRRKIGRGDIAYWERTLAAWGFWVRQGRTWPNTLGYPRATVEARLMDGSAAGPVVRCAKVPTRLAEDREIEELDRVLVRMPEHLQRVVVAKFIRGQSFRDMAGNEATSRSEVHKRYSMALAWVHGAMG